MSYLKEHFPSYDCDENGNVYKDGELIKPFKSNGYLQVYMRDAKNRRHIAGVHSVIAMKYFDYYDGCVVHHKDHNKTNNRVENLEVQTRKEHSRLHNLEGENPFRLNKGKAPWNKGIKMPKIFCEHCSEGQKRRRSK